MEISGGQLSRKGTPTAPMPRLTWSCNWPKRNHPSTYFRPIVGQNQRTNQRQANLAAVGVAAEHERDGLPGGKRQQMIHIVGRMAEQNNRLLRNIADRSGNGGFRIRQALQGVVEPRKPDAAAGALERHIVNCIAP